MNNRRTLIAAILGGGLLLGAAGIGFVYFVVFAGSSPQKLALSSPTPTASGSASSSASTAGAGTWTVTSGSQAGYRVREKLASLPAPSDAVGRTSAVTGTLTLAQSASGDSVTAAVTYRAGRMEVTVDGMAPASDVRMLDTEAAVYVLRQGRQTVVRLKALDVAEAAGAGAGGRVSAPMHGKVLEVLVAPGDAVRKGDRLAVIEAMKMEHTLLAPIDGIVAEVRVTVPAQVAQGAHLMTIEPE